MSAKHSSDIGKTFGRLTVLREESREGRGKVQWRWWCLCRCECGEEKWVQRDNLFNESILSCGCLKREKITAMALSHGHTRGGRQSRAYKSWGAMHQRCGNAKNPSHGDYGGRGIKVCARWSGPGGFESFLQDVGERPPGTTIDRIDNAGDYEPGNVRWATQKMQCRNQRTNRLITFNGRTQCIAAWAEETGIGRGTIAARVAAGWELGEALTRPVKLKG